MDEAVILETTFLIDLERERRSGKPGPAMGLLRRLGHARLCIAHAVAGELAAGLSLARREAWEAFVAPFRLLDHTPDVDWHYGRLFRHLQADGRLIGANDLWTAATALAHELPVVTRNQKHFRRIPDLRVLTYGPGASA